MLKVAVIFWMNNTEFQYIYVLWRAAHPDDMLRLLHSGTDDDRQARGCYVIFEMDFLIRGGPAF